MSIGSFVLKIQLGLAQGPRAAYWREVVRPRILRTEPITGTIDNTCEIHVMTSAGDWLNLMWALKSFYRKSGRRYALCVHEDGTLNAQHRDTLLHHFPAMRYITRAEADVRVAKELEGYPRCAQFRRTNVLAPKLFDFVLYLQSERMLLLDSDVLFYRTPHVLLERIEDPNYRLNTFNSDFESAYNVDPADVRRLAGFELGPCINSGLGLVHRDSIRWDWIEEFLALPGINEGHFWRTEQTLFALCSSRYGVDLLPPEYTLKLTPGIGSRPFRHYVGSIRGMMYVEGIPYLIRQGFLRPKAPRLSADRI